MILWLLLLMKLPMWHLVSFLDFKAHPGVTLISAVGSLHRWWDYCSGTSLSDGPISVFKSALDVTTDGIFAVSALRWRFFKLLLPLMVFLLLDCLSEVQLLCGLKWHDLDGLGHRNLALSERICCIFPLRGTAMVVLSHV